MVSSTESYGRGCGRVMASSPLNQGDGSGPAGGTSWPRAGPLCVPVRSGAGAPRPGRRSRARGYPLESLHGGGLRNHLTGGIDEQPKLDRAADPLQVERGWVLDGGLTQGHGWRFAVTGPFAAGRGAGGHGQCENREDPISHHPRKVYGLRSGLPLELGQPDQRVQRGEAVEVEVLEAPPASGRAGRGQRGPAAPGRAVAPRSPEPRDAPPRAVPGPPWPGSRRDQAGPASWAT